MTTRKPNPGDTRPSRPLGPAATQSGRPPHETQAGVTRRTQPYRGSPQQQPGRGLPPASPARLLLRLLPVVGALFLIFVSSLLAGAGSGRRALAVSATTVARTYLDEQYQLGLQDIQNGNLELARQRFEFIFSQDQSYTAAADRWVELSLLLNATVTPPAAPTATPTLDPRPREELFAQASALAASRQWDQTLQVLAALRRSDPGFRVTEVDGLIYLALRNRGVERILNLGQLESGIYDFSLAEKFGPLDAEAGVYRGWARLYLLGNAFWIAYPEIAAGYYGQLVAVAPNLRDESGLTAFYRYWSSLVQMADQLAAGEDWCGAAAQYRVALGAADSANVSATAQAVEERCLALTPSSTPTWTATLVPSALPSVTATLGAPTLTASETATSTSGPESPTATSQPSATNTAPPASPTETATPAPSTETPTPTPSATETATPGG